MLNICLMICVFNVTYKPTWVGPNCIVHTSVMNLRDQVTIAKIILQLCGQHGMFLWKKQLEQCTLFVDTVYV